MRLERPKHILMGMPAGVAGVKKTLSIMALIVQKYREVVPIRDIANAVTVGLNNKDYFAEWDALVNWIKNNIRYTRDVRTVETLHTPLELLRRGAGDCDDQAILLATLAESIGLRTRFVAIGPTKNNYCHVFAEAFIKGEWIPGETTERWPTGMQPPNQTSRMVHYV